jgi:hypothetical protein
MSTITTSIEVNVPVRTAYNQWTQFEEFPRFMEGVKEVHQVDDRHLHWKAEIGGRKKNGMLKSPSRSRTSVLRGRALAGLLMKGL